jgi:hypothetical protein
MRKILITLSSLALSSMLIFGLMGCEGEKGAAGPAGPSGVNPDSPPIITAVVAAPDSIGSGEHTTLFVSAYDPNGDEMAYAWTAASGTLSATNTSVVTYTPPRELGLYQVGVTVTDNDGSATGTATIGVNVYVPSVFPSYLGDNANRCSHCHSAGTAGWMTTGHEKAYADLVAASSADNLYCVQCHTTGFDDTYDFAGNKLTTGLDNGGFDQNPIAQLQGVQCEACHGPTGPDFSNHEPDLTNPLHGVTCDRCHSQNEEYNTSGHGTSIERAGGITAFNDEWGGSCNACHTSEGFISLHDADWAGRALPAEQWQVTCATCHDVHMNTTADTLDTNPAYLRSLDPVTLAYGTPENPGGFIVEGWGAGQLCVQCHHARRSLDQITTQINDGTSRPGPHASPQADMIAGAGCWEIAGYEYERESPHRPDVVIGESNLEDMCVKCHLYSIPHGDPGGPLYGHSFAPDVRACNTCHATPDDFDYRDRRTEIEGLMAQLLALLPNDGTKPLFTAATTTREQREAGYAWYFVLNEGSMGVHNYEYAKSVLENAIDYASGGRPN